MVRPINYDLEFEPNLKNFTFHGTEIIDVKIPTKTNKKLQKHTIFLDQKQNGI